MYFIAIILPPHLDEKILLFKKMMQENHGCKVGLKSPAHITIISPFWMEALKEAELKEDVKNIAKAVSPFTVSTDNFSAFAPRTLFVAVKESSRLNELKDAADNFFSAKDYGLKKEARPFHPHITIATRDLHKKDFTEAWAYFQNKMFEEGFDADGLSLLKHNGTKWEVIYTASFTE